MKRLSKTLAMLLVIAMMASLICIPSLADEETDPYASLKDGTGMVVLGDSFARGYGASDHFKDQIYENEYYGHYNCRNVDGSYPNLVAEALGMSAPNDIRDITAQFWPVTHDAVSTAYILDLLGIDDGFRDDEYTYQSYTLCRRYSTDLAYFGDPMSCTLDGTAAYGKTGEIMSIRDMLNNASFITVALGQCDVIYRAMRLGLSDIDLSNTENMPAVILRLVDMLSENFEYWKKAYPILLDYIEENNPDAKVVLVGTMNPAQNIMLSEDIYAPVGSAVSIITDMMNDYTKSCAEKYGYMYVDISNVDVISTEREVNIADLLALDPESDEFALMTHPTPAGYAQIARMIVAELDEELAKEAAAEEDEPYIPETPNTFIKVDMGRFENIDYVMVDDNKVSNYSMNDHVLTIPCYVTTADSLTVAVKNSNGTVTLITYSLKYDNGYTAHKVYEVLDIQEAITSTVKNVLNVAKAVTEKAVSFVKNIFSIFKK